MARTELAYIGLGANVGAARVALEQAVEALKGLPEATTEAVSQLYRTRPVGPVEQDDFHNAVVALQAPAGADPAAGAMALLVALKGIERAMGRRERERWGPRELDLDLLLYGHHRIHVERDAAARSDDPTRSGARWLDVPHPAAAERLFVLAPLSDLAPDLEPPGWGISVTEARARAEVMEGSDAALAVAAWDEGRQAWSLPPR